MPTDAYRAKGLKGRFSNELERIISSRNGHINIMSGSAKISFTNDSPLSIAVCRPSSSRIALYCFPSHHM